MVSTERQVPHELVRPRDSLRWRFPVLSGVLLAILLSSFLWVAYRQVEATLITAGANRATAAAEQVADRLSSAIGTAAATTTRVANEPAVAAMLRDPNERTRRAAIAALETPSTSNSLRRYEAWDTAGSLVLEMVEPRADTARLQSYPPGAPPVRAGISPFQRSGRFAFFDIVAEIRADTVPGAEHLGYSRQFGQLTSQGMSIKQLLGSDAIIRIGAPGTLVWTDFFIAVDPPPAKLADREAEYGAEDGRRWIGGFASVEGAPWQVWVGYPRELILSPARTFLRRMLVIALAFLALSVVLATFLGVRLTRPLHELATAAERIAAGDYTRRVASGRSDEIGLLSRAFNTMTSRVEHAHGALRKNHEQTQFLLTTARIGVWESGLDEDRLNCSDSMRVVHGRITDAVPRRRQAFLKQVHPDDRDLIRRVLTGRELSGEVIDLQYRAVSADGSIQWIEGKARVKFDENRRPTSVLGVSVDVTDRRRLESQLRQAQKMEAVGQLAGGVAHDFNNLLTAIVGHAEMVREELPEPSALREDVEDILRAADSAAGLTRQLLAFSRKQVRQPDVIRINTLVAGTEKLLRRLIGENIHVITQLAPDVDAVRADPGQLEQVLVNLVVNARDAMQGGGTLTIKTANVDLTEQYAREHLSVPPGRYVTLEVSDTGTGMDAQTQQHLFEPFFTTKAPGKGSGLGLATVFGIIEQSGGHINVLSEPGHGSTFSVFLPTTADAPRDSQPQPEPAKPPGGAETILVVEDNTAVRTIAKTILERIGYTVLVASSGEEALRIIESASVKLDLVVSDVVMTGMTGPELARQLAAYHPDLRVLFTSGYTGDAVVRQGIEESGMMFLEKPYTPTTLAAEVRKALRRPASSTPASRQAVRS